MDRQEAALTVDRIERLQRATRQRSRGKPWDLWFPLVLFGSLMLITPLIERAMGGLAVGVFWGVAGPIGTLACAWRFRRRELVIGLEIPPAPYLLVSLAIVIGALALGWIGGASGGELQWMGPLLAVSGGYVVFAWIDRLHGLGAVALALAVLVVILATSSLNDDTAAAIATLAYGGAFLSTGLFLKLKGPSGR
ncbi:MAG TPA: hypothetical protein VHJ82_06695 [Actinomycetota bacterium]|nr:hypothetical protein [Actinomycetota bacterium]